MMRILATVILGFSLMSFASAAEDVGHEYVYIQATKSDVATGEIKKFASRYPGSWLRQADASGARARGRGQTIKMTSLTPSAAQRILGGNQ